MSEYEGQYYDTRTIFKMKKCVRGTSRGIYIVTAIGKNTCEWVRLQQVRSCESRCDRLGRQICKLAKFLLLLVSLIVWTPRSM